MQRRRLQPAETGSNAPAASAGDAHDLLVARDRFIAERIAETLPDGATGLLFLGAAHRLESLRAFDIQVDTLGS